MSEQSTPKVLLVVVNFCTPELIVQRLWSVAKRNR